MRRIFDSKSRFTTIIGALLLISELGFATVRPTWRGVTYSPRGHSYFRMLKDWSTVSSTVDSDLGRLASNGFNLVHLYVWDQLLLQEAQGSLASTYPEQSGFCSYPSAPNCTTEASNEWSALESFVAKAESHGLYVFIHFASGQLLYDLNHGSSPAADYSTWAESFMTYLVHTSGHSNIIAWGMGFDLGPVAGQPTSNWSTTARDVYYNLDQFSYARLSGTYGSLGLIAVDMPFGLTGSTPVVDRGSGYHWDWQTAQQIAYTTNSLLTAKYGFGKDPDIYALQLYNAHSQDLQGDQLSDNLTKLTGSAYNPSIARQVPAGIIFVTEFATSSSIDTIGGSLQRGNNILTSGDSNAPTLTPAGQAQ